MKNKKKLIISLVITLAVGILTIIGSFALWTKQIGNNINVALNTVDLNKYIDYTSGKAIFAGDLEITNTYSGGTSTTFQIGTKNNSPYPFYATLNLKIKDISDILTQSSVLKWTVTSKASGTNDSETIVAYGSFNGTKKGQTIQLLPSIEVTSTKTDYIVYLWVDSTNTNSSLVEGGKIDSELWMDVYQYRSPYNETPPNAPELVDGLIPVSLNASGSSVTVANTNQSWYNYRNKEWANAVLVNEDTHTRSYYLNNPGTEIPESDILAYYVWIPRYSYKVWQYEGVSATGSEQEIDIKFVSTSVKELATQNGEYYTHPAFTFGDTELSGIWVGKFETSHTTLSSSTTDNNLGCSSSSCTTYNGLRILPNVSSLRYNNVSNFFYASRAMETSGNDFGISASSTDSHMMKNSEWGAAAYLSHSKYGINDEVRINNQNTYTTGCGAATVNASGDATCSNQYGTQTTYPQSTTGNVTGIFDMSGGSSEYVMGTYNQDNSYGNSTYSGFNSSTNPLPDSKYYDNYTFDSFESCTLATCEGHALNETKNWHEDSANFVNSGNPWFHRGGNSFNVSGAGVFFAYHYSGNSWIYNSFRLVLLVE